MSSTHEVLMNEDVPMNENEIKEAFTFYDPNNTGYIQPEQFHQFLADLTEFISEIDITGDGRIEVEELIKFLP
ncbi:hypothetical protein BGW42_006015 [Actinomortierella wolfii]|nr:hypothetical protein BGW42_006015 [Actinomortierella wolfii]